MPIKSSTSQEKIIKDMLDTAGIAINGPNPFDIQVHNPRLYRRVLGQGLLGLGESYMDGWWDCAALDVFIDKIIRADLESRIRLSPKLLFYMLTSKLLNMQNLSRARIVGEKHYDALTKLFQLMMDKRMNYTCGYWKNAKNLEEAQEAKLELICRKIGLNRDMKVMEFGFGWGSFAKYAAEKYGASISGVSISKKQLELATEICRGLPVDLRLQDYRQVSGQYDAIIAVGMLEHVGPKNYSEFMKTVYRCLKPDGIGLVQAIGGNVSVTKTDPWMHKYIFPNSVIPSIAQISAAMEGLFVIEDLHNFGPDYDLTCMAWHDNFEKAWPLLKDEYDERFYRMWKFYLLLSAGNFRARGAQLWQIVYTKIGRKQPVCRFG